MPLIPQEENKQRIIYKICCFFLILFWLLFGVFFICINFLHLNRHWQDIIGFTFMGSFIPTMIAGNVMYKLKLTNHYEAKSYTLPYTVKKDLTLNYILLGALFLGLIPELFGPLTRDTVILFLIILASIAFLVTLMRWNGVILYEDRLCHYELWTKHIIFYKDIVGADIEYFYGNARHYQLIIKNRNRAKPPIKIHFFLISKSNRIIILNVIHQFAPQATMNELAVQMRNGDFPVA